MSDWRESSWGDEISLEYGKRLQGYKDAKGKYRVFGANGPVGWTDKPLTEGSGVILGRKGVNRGVEFSKDPFFVIDTAYYVKPKSDLDMRWLYYAITHHKLGDINDGSPIPSTTRSAVYVKRFKIPELPEQKTIAHILGSLDDRIEWNRRMNETLEAMAQALFKSWFVDFDPVIDNALAAGNEIPDELKERAEIREGLGDERRTLPEEIRNLFPDEFEQTEEMGWIPKGWNTQPLYDIATFINGAAYKNFHFTDEPGAIPVVKIAEIKNGVSSQTKFTKTELDDKYRIEDGDILFSWSGNPDTSIDTFVWSGGPGWLNQHIFKIVFGDVADRNHVYYLLKYLRPEFAEIARNKQTTGLGHVTAQDMKRLYVVKPTITIKSAFNQIATDLFDQWYSNLLSIKALSKTRDTLLPKLLSGEIRIPEAAKLLEDVEISGGGNGKS